MPIEQLENYIRGELQFPSDRAAMEVFEPATGSCHSVIPISSPADVEAAVVAGESAFNDWSRLSAAERSAFLLRLADLIERDAELLTAAESKDTGKPLTLARTMDIPRAATNLRFFAGLAQAFSSECHPTTNHLNYTVRSPLGVVGCISPWNLPLYLLTWKIAPALAVGNCVIAKPSELTPYTATLFARLCREAKLPPGVLNIVHGPGNITGQALVDHPRVSAISFTGGTVTGRKIAAAVAPTFRKYSLEMGGKNPTIVFADCDYEATLQGSMRAAFSNQGQVCLCGSRLYVEKAIYDRFVVDFVERAKSLKFGDPLDADTQVGAVISPHHLQKIHALVQQGVEDGGEVLCGGHPVAPIGRCASGSFYPPTVIVNTTTPCRINQTEIFGPVVTILSFDNEEELVNAANATPYGLSASIWTSRLPRGHRVASQLQAGVVWINCWLVRDLRTPFGGMKQSGVGREGGQEALRFFTEPRNICVAWSD